MHLPFFGQYLTHSQNQPSTHPTWCPGTDLTFFWLTHLLLEPSSKPSQPSVPDLESSLSDFWLSKGSVWASLFQLRVLLCLSGACARRAPGLISWLGHTCCLPHIRLSACSCWLAGTEVQYWASFLSPCNHPIKPENICSFVIVKTELNKPAPRLQVPQIVSHSDKNVTRTYLRQ